MLRALVLLAAALLPLRNPTPSRASRPAVLAQGLAPAEPPAPASFELDWSAPDGCPDGNAIRADALRLAGASAVGSHHLKAKASIVAAPPAGWNLSLATELDGVPGERSLAGGSCQSLAEAATLMLALILNPDLVLAKPPAASGERSPPPADQLEGATQRWSRRWHLGIHGGIQTGVMQDLSTSFALSLGIALGHLSFRLMPGVSLAQNVYRDPAQGLGGRLWLGSAAALGCWSGALGWLTLGPCLGVEVTRLQGSGLGVAQPRETAVYWSSADLALLLSLPVGHGVQLELSAVGLMPLHRPTVYLEGIGPVSRPAVFGARALGGLAWVFW
jgi:hypothetical protein